MILAILAGLVVFASFAVIGALMSLASALERCRQVDQRWTIVVVERRPRGRLSFFGARRFKTS
jgi:hypothetical protein